MRPTTLVARTVAALGASALALSGCSGTSDGGADEGYKIAVLAASSQNGYSQAVYKGAQRAAKAADEEVELKLLDGQFDANTQLSQMQNAGTTGNYDGIVVVPNDGPSLAAAFPLANDVPVATVLNPIGADIDKMEPQVEGVVSTVAVPPSEAATKQAKLVVGHCADIDPCQVVELLGQLNTPLDNARRDAYNKVLKAESNIKVVATVEGGYDRDTSLTAITNVLQATPNIDVILSNADQQTAGAQVALENAGIDPSSIYLTGGGGTTTAVKAVRKGVWKADYVNFPVSMGEAALDQVLNSLEGNDVKSYVDADKVGDTEPFATKKTLAETPDFTGEWNVDLHRSVPAVRATAISKRFGGTQALAEVSVDLAVGEVHAFVGENGAGKSTLGKVVAGIYTPDSGRLQTRGGDVGRWDTVRAQRAGVVMVAQELALVPELTVEQNVFLGIERHLLGVMRRDLRRRYEELEALAGLGLDPRAVVGNLRIAEQQKVEILRGLARDAHVIVLDEPTSSLTTHETQQLHQLIDELRTQGRSIVYVSHFLDAVLEVSDTVSVLRDGQLVRTASVTDFTKNALVEAMLGRKMESSFPDRSPPVDPAIAPALSVRAISTDHGVESASLEVRPGEIVGLLGLVGSGRTEIAKAIFGEHRLTAGSIHHGGTMRSGRASPATAVRSGIAMVPEDRHKEGLVLGRSVKENVSLASLSRYARGGVTRLRAERRAVRRAVDDLGMRPPAIELPVVSFSGGNQQKALLAKWMLDKPDLIVLDEPTRGVDVGAKRTIYEAIIEMAQAGMAILLISSEHEEVLNLAHRAYLVERGCITEEIDPTTITVDDLLFRLFLDPDPKEGAS